MSWLPNPDAPRHNPPRPLRPAHPDDDVQDGRYREVWPAPNFEHPAMTPVTRLDTGCLAITVIALVLFIAGGIAALVVMFL